MSDPLRRSRRLVVSRQSWRDLLFLHWPVAPEVVQPLIPAPLVADRFGADAFVGVVAFQVRRARPAGVPALWGIDFLETNVRTYVTLEGHGAGVYFFSLDAASRLAMAGARALFGLPYFLAAGELGLEDGARSFAMWRKHSGTPALRVDYRESRPIGHAVPGSLEFFLIERYTLFVRRRIGGLRAVEIRHPPYPLHAVELLALRQTLTAAATIGPLPGNPSHVHYSPGVDVAVLAPRRPAA